MKARIMKRGMLMLLAMFVVAAMLPAAVFAADAAGSAVEVRLKTGSSTVKINGQAITVQAPYETKGTMMVPLSVITKAFGATLKLQDNKIITLTYNDKKVVVTIGSTTVKVNNTSKTVSVAPVIVKNTTMVPVRVIVEAFGAKIGKDTKTKETVITGTRASGAAGSETGIDSDYGKTKVGDSYLGWSMNYPAGLIQTNQSDDGSFVIWADAKQASSVIVTTEQVTDQLTTEELRDELYEWLGSDEVTLDKRTITVGGVSFEKLVTKTKERKMLFEYRVTQKGDFLYIVMAGVQGTDKTVLDSYQTLLNSFTPSFNTSDKALKDITKVKNGQITFHNEDYGMTVKLPTGWYQDRESASPSFFSKDGLLTLEITSLVEGDTAEKWLQRRQAIVHDHLLPSYIRNEGTSTIELQDGSALVYTYEFTLDQKTWQTTNEVFLIKGNYRYALDFIYLNKTDGAGQALFQTTMASIDLDTAYVEANFGLVEDDYDNIDRNKKVSKKSNTYGYSIELPAFWYGYESDFESDFVLYLNNSNGLIIEVYEDQDTAGLNSTLRDYFKDKGFTVESSSNVSVNGKTVSKLVSKGKSASGIPVTETIYAFEHRGNVILVTTSILDAYATTSVLKYYDDVIQSIKFF